MKRRRVAIVTGGGRGIGRAIAEALAETGLYKIMLVSRTFAELSESEGACRSLGAECCSYSCDLTDESQVSDVFSETVSAFGAVDVLINNAGAGVFKPIIDTELSDWTRILNANATTAFLCSREAMRIMNGKGGGSIINIASVVGIKGYPNQGAYTASKHAMVGLTKVIAEEGRAHGIRAHVVCPGGVATEMAKQARPDLDIDILIQPADVAETVLYLLSLPPKITVDLIHLRRFGSSAF
ncbi:MAG: SDR family oxidoreductase [Victivallales bacterium]|nr:SDR family oxidoreductase [Victivallales bacterium]